jgi:hypothetical protein
VSHHLPDTLTHTLSSHLDLGKSRLQTLSWLIIGLPAALARLSGAFAVDLFVVYSRMNCEGRSAMPLRPIVSAQRL